MSNIKKKYASNNDAQGDSGKNMEVKIRLYGS